jgi:hypothetical protein
MMHLHLFISPSVYAKQRQDIWSGLVLMRYEDEGRDGTGRDGTGRGRPSIA